MSLLAAIESGSCDGVEKVKHDVWGKSEFNALLCVKTFSPAKIEIWDTFFFDFYNDLILLKHLPLDVFKVESNINDALLVRFVRAIPDTHYRTVWKYSAKAHKWVVLQTLLEMALLRPCLLAHFTCSYYFDTNRDYCFKMRRMFKKKQVPRHFEIVFKAWSESVADLVMDEKVSRLDREVYMMITLVKGEEKKLNLERCPANEVVFKMCAINHGSVPMLLKHSKNLVHLFISCMVHDHWENLPFIFEAMTGKEKIVLEKKVLNFRKWNDSEFREWRAIHLN